MAAMTSAQAPHSQGWCRQGHEGGHGGERPCAVPRLRLVALEQMSSAPCGF